MSTNISNCSRCGRIYVRNLKGLCPDCLREDEELYEKVYNYLRENPKSTVQQVSQATEVAEERILAFLREDRLLAGEWQISSYPCERCGAEIAGGRYCDRCTVEMQRSFGAIANSLQAQKEAKTGSGYHIQTRKDS